MDQLLGLFLLAVYIVGIVGLAALITYVVIRIFPTERTPKTPAADKPQSSSEDGAGESTQAGRLFRKAKRGTT